MHPYCIFYKVFVTLGECGTKNPLIKTQDSYMLSSVVKLLFYYKGVGVSYLVNSSSNSEIDLLMVSAYCSKPSTVSFKVPSSLNMAPER